MEDARKDLDDVFDSIDELAGKGRFDLIDQQMSLTDMDAQPTAISVGVLYMTLGMETQLQERKGFRRRFEEKLITTVGFDNTREILKDL